MGTGSFPGVKSGRGVTLTPHPLLVPWSRKSRATPLHSIRAERPVQSLSACTRVHFTFLPRLSHREAKCCSQFRESNCPRKRISSSSCRPLRIMTLCSLETSRNYYRLRQSHIHKEQKHLPQQFTFKFPPFIFFCTKKEQFACLY